MCLARIFHYIKKALLMKAINIFTLLFIILLSSCKSSSGLLMHQYPDPVDTSNKKVILQQRKEYEVNGVHADNLFEGARMNNFTQVSKNVFRATISPENKPINASAYFALRIWSEEPRDIELELYYTEHKHRYDPKLSYDGIHWIKMHESDFDTLKAPNIATLRLNLTQDKLFVTGQELHTMKHVRSWSEKINSHKDARHSIIGKSKLDMDMHFIDIYNGTPEDKKAIVVMTRQHPPEVTGHYAAESFVEEILADNALSNNFREQFRILVYPLMNPDGVNEGHWRHNAGGIDLNRDWAQYRQEEPKVVANHMVQTTEQANNNVVVGLDFHSTQKDLYYTLSDDLKSSVYPFKDYWIRGLDNSFDDYTPDDRPSTLNQPITKTWFYQQFGAEGITYEIGDETSRDFVRAKGKAAAVELMQLLVLREEN